MTVVDANRLDALLTAVLVACALTTTGLLVRREAMVGTTGASGSPGPVFIKEWRAGLTKGVRVGLAGALVQLLELADFECPACRSFHTTVKTLRQRYPTQVALTYVHFPLEYHRFAEPAARAAECAGAQGRFEPMHDRLFEQQDSLGLKAWTAFAREAGVPDAAEFEACTASRAPMPRIAEGKSLGKQLDVQGTPTIVINGWKLSRPPTLEELDADVRSILAGTSPFTTDRRLF